MDKPIAPAPPAPEAGRLMSLDAFRGATIAAMMLVNNPGSWKAAYPPLLHAEWHGWTFTDLVFPFFIWIVGVAIPLAFERRLAAGQDSRTLALHAVRRAAIIFALGFFLNSFGWLINGSLAAKGPGPWLEDYLANVRIPGVLQRIALCYLIASLIYLRSGLRGQIAWTAGLLGVYWAAMQLIPVPGCGAGSLAERCNLAQFLDQLILGAHCYRGTEVYDPEGIFSTLPAVATCLFGVLTGRWLRAERPAAEKAAWLFAVSCLLWLAGEVMSWWLPINKKLWTSSYAVFMAGMAGLCLGVAYWFIDVQGWRRWAKPLVIYGMNAITVFVLAGLLGRLSLELKVPGAEGRGVALKAWLYETLFAPLARGDAPLFSPPFVSLLWALGYVLALYLVAWIMYRRRWFLRV